MLQWSVSSQKVWLCLYTAHTQLLMVVVIAVQSANCSNGELRIRNESNEVSGRLEYCDNQVWFAFRFTSPTWESALATASSSSSRRWNGYLACKALGYSGLGLQDFIVSTCYTVFFAFMQISWHIWFTILTKTTSLFIPWASFAHPAVDHLVWQNALALMMIVNIRQQLLIELESSVKRKVSHS